MVGLILGSSIITVQCKVEPRVSSTPWHTITPVLPVLPSDNRTANIPPYLEITSPINQTSLATNNATLTVNVASSFWAIDSVYYEADWQSGIHQIFGWQSNYVDSLNASISVDFEEIPNGNHTVTVYANTHDESHSNATVKFSTERLVTKPELVLSPSEITYISILVVVVLASAGLLLYQRHRKTANLKQ